MSTLARTDIFGPDTPRWVSYDDAAYMLCVDPRTIRRAVERGDVAARRFSTAIRIDADSLARYFAPVNA
ncbi:helix-turn-helix domain-containing protein [Gordonia polyisoprenivorans]|uniref:helix-turn-helix domain-containing protein n=1 Tax=Gordonia polyisoprenivorans TaxID=84595 RepID=UPI001AD71C83|nr:helix-turn-helix domain-containing protein [Gordonia polyisoprenivorans]QTI67646.1 helix-turn-helix domain-containing protein [Gordonia polyisoprenivorans]